MTIDRELNLKIGESTTIYKKQKRNYSSVNRNENFPLLINKYRIETIKEIKDKTEETRVKVIILNDTTNYF